MEAPQQYLDLSKTLLKPLKSLVPSGHYLIYPKPIDGTSDNDYVTVGIPLESIKSIKEESQLFAKPKETPFKYPADTMFVRKYAKKSIESYIQYLEYEFPRLAKKALESPEMMFTLSKYKAMKLSSEYLSIYFPYSPYKSLDKQLELMKHTLHEVNVKEIIEFSLRAMIAMVIKEVFIQNFSLNHIIIYQNTPGKKPEYKVFPYSYDCTFDFNSRPVNKNWDEANYANCGQSLCNIAKYKRFPMIPRARKELADACSKITSLKDLRTLLDHRYFNNIEYHYNKSYAMLKESLIKYNAEFSEVEEAEEEIEQDVNPLTVERLFGM